jgi:hypothetical protein
LQSNPHSRVVDIKITPVQNGIEFENPRVPTESRAQIVQLNEKKKNRIRNKQKETKNNNAVLSNLRDAWSLYKTPGFQKNRKKERPKEETVSGC